MFVKSHRIKSNWEWDLWLCQTSICFTVILGQEWAWKHDTLVGFADCLTDQELLRGISSNGTLQKNLEMETNALLPPPSQVLVENSNSRRAHLKIRARYSQSGSCKGHWVGVAHCLSSGFSNRNTTDKSALTISTDILQKPKIKVLAVQAFSLYPHMLETRGRWTRSKLQLLLTRALISSWGYSPPKGPTSLYHHFWDYSFNICI